MLLRDDEESRRKMFSLLLRYLFGGVIIGWLMLSALLYLDVSGIRTMVLKSSSAFVLLPLMYALFAITFGSISMGIGIMGVNDDDDNDGGGHRFHLFPEPPKLSPIKVQSAKRNRY